MVILFSASPCISSIYKAGFFRRSGKHQDDVHGCLFKYVCQRLDYAQCGYKGK